MLPELKHAARGAGVTGAKAGTAKAKPAAAALAADAALRWPGADLEGTANAL